VWVKVPAFAEGLLIEVAREVIARWLRFDPDDCERY
jgi:hypothetical protein